MARIRLDRMLVVDVEETCWEGEPPPDEHAEIIEIGVAEVLLDGEPRLGRVSGYMVRPFASRVSPFCTTLTGITPTDVRKGRPLTEVCNTIAKEFGGKAKGWSAWGRDDRAILRDCAATGASMPFSDAFTDLGALWGMLSGADKAAGMLRALGALGMEFDGTHHRAADDALNTARIVVALSGLLRARPAVDPQKPTPAP